MLGLILAFTDGQRGDQFYSDGHRGYIPTIVAQSWGCFVGSWGDLPPATVSPSSANIDCLYRKCVALLVSHSTQISRMFSFACCALLSSVCIGSIIVQVTLGTPFVHNLVKKKKYNPYHPLSPLLTNRDRNSPSTSSG